MEIENKDNIHLLWYKYWLTFEVDKCRLWWQNISPCLTVIIDKEKRINKVILETIEKGKEQEHIFIKDYETKYSVGISKDFMRFIPSNYFENKNIKDIYDLLEENESKILYIDLPSIYTGINNKDIYFFHTIWALFFQLSIKRNIQILIRTDKLESWMEFQSYSYIEPFLFVIVDIEHWEYMRGTNKKEKELYAYYNGELSQKLRKFPKLENNISDIPILDKNIGGTLQKLKPYYTKPFYKIYEYKEKDDR